LDFSASINPLGPPESAIAAIQSHLRDLSAYPDPAYQSLRGALSQFHQLSPEWILPGNGAAELLTWACRELAELESTYLMTPAFGDYGRSLRAFGAQVETIPLDLPRLLAQPGVAPQLDWFASVLLPSSPPRHRRGLLLNNPHNPTGTLFPLDTLLSSLDQWGLVVVDEAFMDFLPPDTAPSLLEMVQEHPNLVVLRSLTKFYSLPGLRLGYAVAHPDRLQRWQQWRDPWPVNALAVAAAEAVLIDVAFQRQTWDWLPTARSQLFQGLAALPGLQPYSGAANFLLVKTQRPGSSLQAQLLQRFQILIRDCLSFPELGEGAFRVAVRTQAENQRLLEALAAIG
jgi:L-threonine-O-3-phosphate decarboxylase